MSSLFETPKDTEEAVFHRAAREGLVELFLSDDKQTERLKTLLELMIAASDMDMARMMVMEMIETDELLKALLLLAHAGHTHIAEEVVKSLAAKN